MSPGLGAKGNLCLVVRPRITSPGKRLRELMQNRTVVMPGVYDAITAKLAQSAGAEAIYLSGAGVTNAMTGFPDIALITLTEMARQAAYVCQAVQLPVVADADTGYGGTLNVARTVREFERAGLAGMHIEDQASPKRCGHLEGKQLVEANEMVAKVAAALSARSDPNFLVIARTDARGVTGLADAIDRARRYAAAGADCIFPEGLESKDEFAEFRSAVPGPLLANMTEFGKTPIINAAEFAELGYTFVIFPMSAFRVMMKAVGQAYETLLREGTQAGLLHRMRTRAELYDLIEYSVYEALDKKLAEKAEQS